MPKKAISHRVPDRFMVVAFTEHHDALRPFEVWPQHVTVVPWMQGYRAQAANRIETVLKKVVPVTVSIDGEALFGPVHEAKVWTLTATDLVQSLHETVLAAAIKYDARLEDPTFVGEGYSPHITQKAGQPAREVGETLLLDEVSVIGRHEAFGKMIFRNIGLGGHEAAA